MQMCTIIFRLFVIIAIIRDLHSHRKEIGTEHFIRIRIAKIFGSPNIPTLYPACLKHNVQVRAH